MVFLTKFMVKNGCFSLNDKVENLFNYCFRKIGIYLQRIQLGNNKNSLGK